MKVSKEMPGGVEPQAAGQAGELAAVNRFAKKPLTPEEVYLFSVRLCDNQVDREGECFDRQALEKLAGLFVGKTGIFDHAWSARNQAARIYRTEIVTEAGETALGEGACYLKGYAYMLRTRENGGLIAEIDGGIKKEVSVGCAVERCVCSICGNDISDRSRCSHVKGREYEGRRCVVRLVEPTDAYEWSFVAVPAQPRAGVVKALAGREDGLQALVEALREEGSLKSLLASAPREVWSRELRQMEKEAACGRRYLEALRRETVRLGLMAEAGLDRQGLERLTKGLEVEDLEELKGSYETLLAKRFPPAVQLSYGERDQERAGDENSVFVI